MKRAIIIGIGCLLITGCGPEGASHVEDEAAPLLSTSDAAPLLSTSDVETLEPPTIDSPGFGGSIKPCPACCGQWNGDEGLLDYVIPDDVAVSSTALTLVLQYEDQSVQTCVFKGLSSADEMTVDCASKGSPVSATLVFYSGSERMSADLSVVTTTTYPPIN